MAISSHCFWPWASWPAGLQEGRHSPGVPLAAGAALDVRRRSQPKVRSRFSTSQTM